MYMNKHTVVYHMLILLMKFRNWWTLLDSQMLVNPPRQKFQVSIKIDLYYIFHFMLSPFIFNILHLPGPSLFSFYSFISWSFIHSSFLL